MSRIWALLVLVGACAALLPPPPSTTTTPSPVPPPTKPPPYVESVISLHKAGSYLQEHLLHMNGSELITNYRRHYAIIVTALGEFADFLSQHCMHPNYNQDYIVQLDKNMIVGLSNPKYIINKLKKYFDLVYDNTDKVRELTRSCKHPRPEDCDYVVDYLVTHDPTIYMEQATLLLEVGKASNLYIEKADSFLQMSKSYTEEAALINGADVYKELLLQLSIVIKKVEPRLLC